MGLVVTAANFAAAVREQPGDAFRETDVHFRYTRPEPGPHAIIETKRTILHINTIKGFGSSYAFIELVLRYDGNNIITAYTEPSIVSGYEGGVLGSDAAVTFAAIEASAPTEDVTQAYLTFRGFNNPSGPGFQRFTGRIRVTGAGEVVPEQCKLTEGDGIAQLGPGFCRIDW